MTAEEELAADAEIVSLTQSWVQQAGGREARVVVAAATNVLVTVGVNCPLDVRLAIAEHLHVVANRLGAPLH